MVVGEDARKHLTYCLNVHPGEDWDANLQAIRKYALEVRSQVAPGQPFGLGLRLSAAAAVTLSNPARLAELQQVLKEHDLYVFTINGFPYGAFHDTVVKQNVYAPDWRTAERLTYTTMLADILASLLPEGVSGSISTVPGSYRDWIQDASDRDAIATNLARCAEHLASVEQRTGRHIALALEPEPDCLFDTTEQTLEFFNRNLSEHPAMRTLAFDWRVYIGVCFDTCHLSVVFDDPAESLGALLSGGITVPKVQISAALRAPTGAATAARLADFADGTYLHQMRTRRADGKLSRYADLTPEAMRAVATEDSGEVRVHVHVPLYFEASGPLRSTASDLSDAFFAILAESSIPHLEIETYTFNVLPPELASMPIQESIAREYAWVLDRVGREVWGSGIV